MKARVHETFHGVRFWGGGKGILCTVDDTITSNSEDLDEF